MLGARECEQLVIRACAGFLRAGLAPLVPAYSPPVGWSASVAPSGLTKVSSPANITAGPAAVTVNNGTTPVFSWHNPTSMSCINNTPGGASTTLTASGMSPGEFRSSGTIWCRVSDNGGANVASLSVALSFYRTDFS